MEYPKQRRLDSIRLKVDREGEFVQVCLTDATPEERRTFLHNLGNMGLDLVQKRMNELFNEIYSFIEGADTDILSSGMIDPISSCENIEEYREKLNEKIDEIMEIVERFDIVRRTDIVRKVNDI